MDFFIAVGALVLLMFVAYRGFSVILFAPVAAMQDVATPDRPLTRISVAGGVVTAAGAAALGIGLFGDAGDATLWTILGGVLVSFIGIALLNYAITRQVQRRGER